MVGYSEVLQVMGAMVIFSLILVTSNSMILRNTKMEVESELEYEAIALAQDIIEEARVKQFDANTATPLPPAQIPSGFTDVNRLGPSGGFTEDERHEFNDFDDFDGWTGTAETEHGEFTINVEVFYISKNTFDYSAVPTTFKKMKVTVTSKFLIDNADNVKKYQFDFIKNYYAN